MAHTLYFRIKLNFFDLGLIIIDEQHRFGVHQRLALKEKNSALIPHQLIMTATPIPRTLSMLAYADLDLSIIDELPPGRIPITTTVTANNKRQEVLTRIAANCAKGSQAYWVCTLIEESENLEREAAEKTAAELMTSLPDLKVGLIHGRLTGTEKQQIMLNFKQSKIDLLVATTVIEVGVDVPNANLMVIENPEKLGLAQLHQLRGRIGRGKKQSFCVLLYQPPLSFNAKKRLETLRQTNDGFLISEEDLKLRGPGELLGTRQTGLMTFRIADIIRDQAMIPEVQIAADRILEQEPSIAKLLINMWIRDKEKYGGV